MISCAISSYRDSSAGSTPAAHSASSPARIRAVRGSPRDQRLVRAGHAVGVEVAVDRTRLLPFDRQLARRTRAARRRPRAGPAAIAAITRSPAFDALGQEARAEGCDELRRRRRRAQRGRPRRARACCAGPPRRSPSTRTRALAPAARARRLAHPRRRSTSSRYSANTRRLASRPPFWPSRAVSAHARGRV